MKREGLPACLPDCQLYCLPACLIASFLLPKPYFCSRGAQPPPRRTQTEGTA
jgi:hypothetical protein